MRSHGVVDFPDPKQVGGSIQISGARPGGNATAERSCRHLLPRGGQPTRADQERGLARMLRSAECMRARGISGFPDPTRSAPKNRAGYSDVMSNGSAWLAIPGSIDIHSTVFEQAAAACNLGLS